MSGPPPSLAPEITLAETYQIDSDDYDSDQERDDLEDDEYDKLVEEAENGYSDDDMKYFTSELKEQGLVNFLRDYLFDQETGEMRSLRKLLLGFGIIPPIQLRNPSTPDIHLLSFAKIALSRILRRRTRLERWSTLEDAVELIRHSRRIIVLSGAGISTSCGIPDFRSSTGLYANLQNEGKFDLDDPQQMFDIVYFREKPEVFYSFAKQIYPSNFIPSQCHRWIKMLDDKGYLLRNYTQNIDTLESLAGVERVLQCHGSFKTASCLRCKTRVPGQNIEPYIMSQKVPYCTVCKSKRAEEVELRRKIKAQTQKKSGNGRAKIAWEGDDDSSEEEESEWGGGEPGIMKPDITFFGQALDSEFDECLFKDREEVDLLVIIGTSLKVAPVSEVLTHIPHSVPQININLTPVHHVHPDICLLGDADSIVTYLSERLGWEIPPPAVIPKQNSADLGKEEEGDATKTNEKPDAVIPSRSLSSRIPILPEEGEWLSGEGDTAHIHRYVKRGTHVGLTNPLSNSTQAAAPFLANQRSTSGTMSITGIKENERHDGDRTNDGDDGDVDEHEEYDDTTPDIESLRVVEVVEVEQIDDGYLSDESDNADERPSKRAKGSKV
ncbi:uncharacterized protein I303_102218 [Kwoniella dejecticola CBS 10117]|uniref:NAD-dependent histone deacetylase SIR2 n=1 Tax=Kwoniella dejecticola CBS 10117 TaxID=1296121 RepID=A0A1A6ABM3_9TREE|nr:NAD-dependent histone deacetylase SIR2 [Kwoniella dejecticola CBS 10117]OBR87438.1 NAD-dependent histone deacetylase SIR2 [Kwoniella dejecticola CBS 10117]